MTDTSSSPRWWDFDEFSSTKPSKTQTVTQDHPDVTSLGGDTFSVAAPLVSTDESDAVPTDEFLASLPDDMAEAELEVAGYATTPPVEDQAVPPPPAASSEGDWVLPSMPGFAADLPTPPAPAATGAALVDLPDAAEWAAEAEALEREAAAEEQAFADWDIPAVPGLHSEPAESIDAAQEPEAAFYQAASAEAGDGVAVGDAYEAADYEAADYETAEEDENVEYIPGVWSEDGGSWTQEGQEDRWTSNDGAGSVVTTDMPDWVYEGPSTADEGWDQYDAYQAALGEDGDEAEGAAVVGHHPEAADYPSGDGDDWATAHAEMPEPVAVAPIPPPSRMDELTQGEDQTWDAATDGDSVSWDAGTDEYASWDKPAQDASSVWAVSDEGDTSWDNPSATDTAGDSTSDWTDTTDGTEPSWMTSTSSDEDGAPSADQDEPITWEDINTWADESNQVPGDLADDLADPTTWGTDSASSNDWDTPETVSWDKPTPAAPEPASDWASPPGLPSVDTTLVANEAEATPAWDIPGVIVTPDASDDDQLTSQPDAFGTPAEAAFGIGADEPAEVAGTSQDWQVTDTESSWATASQDATPAWGAPEEDTTTSWTTGEADVTPTWGAGTDAGAQWAEADTAGNQWDAPATPGTGSSTPESMSFAEPGGGFLADPLSEQGDPAGFPAADTHLPPPPPGGVPMAPEDLPDWMRPDEPEEAAAPLPLVSEEEAMAEEIAAPFNPVIAGVEEAPAGAMVQDPGLITAPIPEDELPPEAGSTAQPPRPTWGQPGPSGIGPAPITSPTLSHPVPDGDQQNFSVAGSKKGGKASSVKRILIAVLTALLVMGGGYAAWEFAVRPYFFESTTGVSSLAPGKSSVTFAAEADHQVQWTIDVNKGEAFALTMEIPDGVQVGFLAQNAQGDTIGAANPLEDGKNGYRFVAQNDVDGPITLTAKASDAVSAELNMRIAPFAGSVATADGLKWNVTVPMSQSAIINVLTRGTNPNVVISTADGTEIGSSESFQSPDDEQVYNAQFKVPAQEAEQAIVITLKTDQAYDATSTLIVDLSN